MNYFAAREHGPRLPLQNYALLAGWQDNSWGVFQTESEVIESSDVCLLPRSLELLIYDAHKFPPALALARNEVDRALRKEDTLEKMLNLYEATLIHHLSNQMNTFCQLLHTAPGEYPEFAGYYWVLDKEPEDPDMYVRYISDDFFIYELPAHRFTWK